MVAFQHYLNRLFIYVLSAILLAAYSYQIIRGREPCPLCFLQRVGITGIGAALMMNLRFGIRTEHYGLAIISALIGRIFALRHINFHVCPSIPLFGNTILGFDLYLWSYFIFTCSLFSIAILLILFGVFPPSPISWKRSDKIGCLLFALITLGNVINSFIDKLDIS
jgi:hypothetical protein